MFPENLLAHKNYMIFSSSVNCTTVTATSCLRATMLLLLEGSHVTIAWHILSLQVGQIAFRWKEYLELRESSRSMEKIIK